MQESQKQLRNGLLHKLRSRYLEKSADGGYCDGWSGQQCEPLVAQLSAVLKQNPSQKLNALQAKQLKKSLALLRQRHEQIIAGTPSLFL